MLSRNSRDISDLPVTSNWTSMLPRVAFEYGQRSWARATRSSAAAWSSAGTSATSVTREAEAPLAERAELDVRGDAWRPRRRPTSPSRMAEERMAFAKHAA